MKQSIRIGIIGVGNCASSLLQGVQYYNVSPKDECSGILYWDIGGYGPSDITVASAFDIDSRKVGRDISEAIFAAPNCTAKFVKQMDSMGVTVSMGKILDGMAPHMEDHPPEYTFVASDSPQPEKDDVVDILRQTGTEILLNYLPVGSEEATRFYAKCALAAGCAFINNIPVFIASDPAWANRFSSAGLPLIGDDIKSQLGATIVHRVLTNLFAQRGVKLDRTYQLNSGGNTDFLNMKDQNRLSAKKESKTEAVQSVAAQRLHDRNVHIGPSDYIPWLKDNKVAFIRMEGRLFGDVPMNLELRLSVEDSPNSAGSAIDTIRICKLAMERGLNGVLEAPSALYCKHPPKQYTDDVAFAMTQRFIFEE